MVFFPAYFQDPLFFFFFFISLSFFLFSSLTIVYLGMGSFELTFLEVL